MIKRKAEEYIENKYYAFIDARVQVKEAYLAGHAQRTKEVLALIDEFLFSENVGCAAIDFAKQLIKLLKSSKYPKMVPGDYFSKL